MNFIGSAKKLVKNALIFLHLDITKNIKYDRLTKLIIDKVVKPNSICIDVGAHKGEILDLIRNNAPDVKHYAFEPIPDYYNELLKKYSNHCHVFPYALSEKEEVSTFQYVKNAPAYSGIKERTYAVKEPIIEELKVQLKPLDEIIPISTKIDFIKIDVEGAEFLVLKGATKTIKKHKPIIVFECGIGASDHYGTLPETLFDFIEQELQLRVSTLDNFNKGHALTRHAFYSHFKNRSEYYFVAHP